MPEFDGNGTSGLAEQMPPMQDEGSVDAIENLSPP